MMNRFCCPALALLFLCVSGCDEFSLVTDMTKRDGARPAREMGVMDLMPGDMLMGPDKGGVLVNEDFSDVVWKGSQVPILSKGVTWQPSGCTLSLRPPEMIGSYLANAENLQIAVNSYLTLYIAPPYQMCSLTLKLDDNFTQIWDTFHILILKFDQAYQSADCKDKLGIFVNGTPVFVGSLNGDVSQGGSNLFYRRVNLYSSPNGLPGPPQVVITASPCGAHGQRIANFKLIALKETLPAEWLTP